jgi:hypothetical protein
MSEAWVLELLSSVRDIARQNGYHRLAEHLDDGMLIAASEAHRDTIAGEGDRGYDGPSATTFRGDARTSLH